MSTNHSDVEKFERAHENEFGDDFENNRPWHAHSRAYLLAVIGFLGIFLFGYDTGLGGGVIALESFQRDFGIDQSKGPTFVANIQGNIVAILQGGAFFGAIFGGQLENKLGRKWSLMVGSWIFVVGAIVQVVATTGVSSVYGGRFTAGFGVGLMSVVCPTYASEIAPRRIRGRITGLFQIVVVVGVAFSFWINYGVSFMDPKSNVAWRVPIGFQLVPVGIMIPLLFVLKESPRWLATQHRDEQGINHLAWIRKLPVDHPSVQFEYAEITAAVREEEAATQGVSIKEVMAKGNPIRFLMAFVIFTLQQWSGQNSISYYAPLIFKSIGLTGKSTGLLASDIYGIVKIVTTSLFVAFGVDRFGRKKPLLIGVALMSMFLWIIGAIFNTHQPKTGTTGPVSSASIAMAVMIYLFVVPYCFSVGPLPWVICSEIFNNRTRHLGLSVAAATQWAWNFGVTKATPLMVLKLPHGGIFFFFAAINMISFCLALFLPETKGRSLEDMDVLFGAITQSERDAAIASRAHDMAVQEKQSVEHDEDVEKR